MICPTVDDANHIRTALSVPTREKDLLRPALNYADRTAPSSQHGPLKHMLDHADHSTLSRQHDLLPGIDHSIDHAIDHANETPPVRQHDLRTHALDHARVVCPRLAANPEQHPIFVRFSYSSAWSGSLPRDSENAATAWYAC